MLMHTKGILVMTPDSAMVLTGKQSLDFSGGVSAEDNFGIGGFDRVMGPNGQAQYWAPNLGAARDVLAKIAAVLHETRFAETKGSGIRVMREGMEQAGLTPPLFESDQCTSSTVAVGRASEMPSTSVPRVRSVLPP